MGHPPPDPNRATEIVGANSRFVSLLMTLVRFYALGAPSLRVLQGRVLVWSLMPEGLQRRYGQGHLHFITCSCYRRLPLLGTDHSKNLFVKILDEVRDRYEFALTGYVVMPEHVHLLVSEPVKGTPSTIMQVLKQRVSSRLKNQADPSDQGLQHVWEPRFYDFNVWSQEKITEKLHYMHLNPLKRGLISHPKGCVWSSFSFYSDGDGGLIRIDPYR